jgi:hypothetical protein
MTPQETPVEDDPTILPTETLFRFGMTATWISYNPDDDVYVISNMLFSRHKNGTSVEFQSLIDEDTTVDARLEALGAFGVVSVTAENVRTLVFKNNNNKEVKGDLKIAYTPIKDGAPYGPNRYHGDIFKMTDSSDKALSRLAVEVRPVNQEKARAAYARKLARIAALNGA